MRMTTMTMAAALATLAAGVAAAQERLIAQGAGVVAVTSDDGRCGDPVAVTLRAPDAAFFADREAVQRTVDGVRAILGFECARTPMLDLRGERRSGEEPIFVGVAGDATGWLVQESGVAPEALDSPAGRFRVAGVDVGMTPAQAVAALEADFGAAPAFDAAAGRIEAQEGPAGAVDEPRPPVGARRLEGVFTGGAAPRLSAATLRQTVDGDQRAGIATALEERYGPPASRREEGGATMMGWGQPLASDGARRELEAVIEATGAATVLTLARADPQATAAPQLRVRF